MQTDTTQKVKLKERVKSANKKEVTSNNYHKYKQIW